MAKKRVYELAKELGIENKTLLDILTKEGINDKKAASALEDNIIDLIKSKFPENQVSSVETSIPTNENLISEDNKISSSDEKTLEESKAGISNSIKERMALRTQNLKDKFSSGSRFKEKLAMRSKEEPVEDALLKEDKKIEEKIIEKAPEKVEVKAPEPVAPVDFSKKKLKEMGSVTQESREPREMKDKVTFSHGKSYREHGGHDRGFTPHPPPASSIAVIDKKPEEKPVESLGDKLKSKKGKKERDKGFKKKDLEEEKRQLAKALATKKKKRDADKRAEEELEEPTTKEVEIFDGMNVKDIAEKLRNKETEIIKELFMKGIMVTVNQALDRDLIVKIVNDHGFTVKEAESKADEMFEMKVEEMSQDESLLEIRPPVVTIMGHVDHGKTSLLDAIRKTKITEGEAGGITQHIGAYQVHAGGRLITFLDTPGHEAFTAMRARGAKATDIAVLVVAADDGVMPQTIEAINHAKAASVPIIVAINKMDKPDSNPDRVKQQLAEHELVPEDWGGSTVTVPVSARSKMGIDDLLDMILLTADLQEIKSNPNKLAQGVIIESKLDKGKGPVATVLIQAGTLRVGDNFVVGTVSGKVRAMFNYLGQQVKEAPPSSPVQVIGYSAVPVAGELFKVVPTDKEARDIAEKTQLSERERALSPVRTLNLESISEQIEEGKLKELNLVIKADVQGSAEALSQSLSKLTVDDVRLRIIHSAVGDVSETDVSLAAASSAIVIAFNVRVEPKTREMAEKERVDVRTYNIIYRVIEDVQKALEGLLEPEFEEVLTGKALVRQTFTIGKSNVVAGCYVTDGKIVRNATIRLMRGTTLIHTGKIDSLKRFKDDVKEVATGFECGMSLEKFNDIQENDIFESYVMQVKTR